MGERNLRAIDLRHTLPNLHNLMLTVTSGRGAELKFRWVVDFCFPSHLSQKRLGDENALAFPTSVVYLRRHRSYLYHPCWLLIPLRHLLHRWSSLRHPARARLSRCFQPNPRLLFLPLYHQVNEDPFTLLLLRSSEPGTPQYGPHHWSPMETGCLNRRAL